MEFDLINTELLSGLFADAGEYMPVMAAGLMLALGVLMCFLGYRSFKGWCVLMGVVLGAVIGIILASFLAPAVTNYSELLSIIFIVLLAVIGGLIAYRAYLAGVFLYAFASLFVLSYSLIAPVTEQLVAAVIAVCLGIAAGILAVVFQRMIIIVVTCLFGGTLIAQGLTSLFGDSGNPMLTMVLPIAAVALFVIGGFFVQIMTTKKPAAPTRYTPPKPAYVSPADAAAAAAQAAPPAEPAEPQGEMKP